MKKIMLTIIFVFSLGALFAQQRDGIKLQKADESGFFEVDKAPELKSQLQPVYPQIAKLAGIQGVVYLKLLVNEKGKVEEIKILQGAKEMLDNAAIVAAKEAKFSPALIGNKPVKVWIILPVSFKLDVDKTQGENRTSQDVNVTDEVQKMPELIESVNPVYPEEAKKNGIKGKVYLKVFVNEEGLPKEAMIMKSTNEIFNQPAIDAALKCKFTPAIKDDKPIAVWVVIPYKFDLDASKQ